MARHIHADLIHAWADGAEIQFKNEHGNWMSVSPTWGVDTEYRIKPRIVKKEGWVNVYKGHPNYNTGVDVHSCFKKAHDAAPHGCVATVKIEWEEEE